MAGTNEGGNSTELPPKFDLQQQHAHSARKNVSVNVLDITVENSRTNDPFAEANIVGTVKKSHWFTRGSTSGDDKKTEILRNNCEATKKKRFGFGYLFGRQSLMKEKPHPVAGQCPSVIYI
jgi:hypothetical protein